MAHAAAVTVLLLDTHSLFYRAHHALPPMNTSSGEPTAALYGFSSLLLKLLREQRPRAVAFALDAGRSFRADRFDGYKAHRARMPDELRSQLPRLLELLDAFGVPRWAATGFEGDDVLATLAATIDGEILVVSGDRDLLQVIDARVRVLFVGRRGQDHVLYDHAKVIERFAVGPERLPSLVALTGDGADALPGVPGVGVKTAAAWVREYGRVAAIVEAVDRLKPARLREAIRERSAQLLLNEELATLRTDVPLDGHPRCGAITREALVTVREFFERQEFRSLLPRLDALAAAHAPTE